MPATPDGLEGLLNRWDRALVAMTERDEALSEPFATTRTVLRAPASETQVAALEARLGVRLPPSYRAFLLLSNGAFGKPGWDHVLDPAAPPEGSDCGLLPAEAVGWVRDREPFLLEAWAENEDLPLRLTEAEYLDHDRPQDPCQLRVDHMPHLLCVSCSDWGQLVLLNPLVVTADGEWEAWEFGDATPGAYRYASFAALLDAHIHQLDARPGPAARAAGPTATAESAAALARALDRTLPDHERFAASIEMLRSPDLSTRVPELAELAAADQPRDLRQNALRVLADLDAPGALDVLLDHAATSDERMLAVIVDRLLRDPDPRARAAGAAILGSPDLTPLVAGAVDAGRTEAVHDAWLRTGNPVLTLELNRRYDDRATEATGAALRDPGLDPELRARLVWSAMLPAHRPLVPDIVTAFSLGGVDSQHAATVLMHHEAWDEAFEVLAPHLDDPRLAPDRLEQALLLLARDGGHRGAADLLVRRFRARPTARRAGYLGGLDLSAARAALEDAARSGTEVDACVRALARMPGTEARAVLERLATHEGPARGPAGDALEARARSGR